jgi:ankyrin repeat protein
MRFAPDILTPQDLQNRIADATKFRIGSWQHLLPPEQVMTIWRAEKESGNGRGWCEQSGFMSWSLELARLLNAQGAVASQFRDTLREAVIAYEPVAAICDSAEGQGNALCAALVCWEFEAAERMATACNPGQPQRQSRGNCLGLWRAAILGRTQEAIAFLDAMPEPRHGNPPQRHELAEGVIRGDAKLVRAGLKATSDRFKKAWTLKTWGTPGRLKYYGAVARMVPDVCRQLITHNWLLSDWAVAWMSLAWHRGLTAAFGEPKYFSPWVPWELCCPEPNPSPMTAGRTVTARSKKPGKRELRAKFFTAAACGNVKAIQSLVAQEVQLDTLNQDRQTALMVAVHYSRAPVVVALIQAGADATLLDPKGRTALGIAADLGMIEMVRTILACGVKPDSTDKPVSPLVRASRGGHFEIVRALLKAGADPNRISSYGNSSALTDAIEKNHVEVVHELVAAGANVNTPVEDACNAIQYAITAENPDLIQFLLKAGADVNALNWWGGNALYVAADLGSPEILALMIKAGATINIALKRDGFTPLMAAVPHPECVKLLLKAGADVTARNKQKQTALDLAREYPESLKLLESHRGRAR